MSSRNFSNYLTGTSIIIGAILMLIATLLHPPLVNPYDGKTAFQGFSDADFWMWDHILMLIATSLWLIGLAGSEHFFANRSKAAKLGSCLFFVSLSLWIFILAAELTALPILGEEFIKGRNRVLLELWQAIFSLGLLAGYFAVMCSWLGICLYGWSLKQTHTDLPSLFTKGAFFSGLIGVIGIILTFLSFNMGYILIPLTSAPPYLWSIWLGWKIMKNGYLNE